MSSPVVAPIDPLAETSGGGYEDGLVTVRRRARNGRSAVTGEVRTAHFEVVNDHGKLLVRHCLDPDQVDDDLAGLLDAEVFAPGWVRGSELFERIFAGVVLSSAETSLEAWELFYRNTLRRIETAIGHDGPRLGRPPGDGAVSPSHGSIAGYAPVYAHAESLLPTTGTVLELGSCFGFFALRLAARGVSVTASDLSPGTVRLLESMADRLGLPVPTLVADAARVPLEDGVADTVVALHLLEHVEPEDGDDILAETVRLARRRVVLAVPFEDEPEEAYGHVRTVTLADLRAWGEASGLDWEAHEHHGGWLVLDRATAAARADTRR